MKDGTVNFDALPALIEHLLAHHTDEVLLAGVTAGKVNFDPR